MITLVQSKRQRFRAQVFALQRMAQPMLWRYVGLLLQFAIVLLVARSVDLEIAGGYFALFGAVAVVHLASGLGIPDAIVKLCPVAEDSASLRSMGLMASTIINIPLCGFVLLIALACGQSVGIATLFAIWLFGYAEVLAISQAMITFRSGTWGNFGMYASINIGYMLTLVPYLFIADSPTLSGMVYWATMGALLSCASLMIVVICTRAARCGDIAPAWNELVQVCRSAGKLITIGMPIATARLLQGMLPWLPVWLLAVHGDPGGAATYAAASRLAVVATAVLGSIRFSSRPEIVTLAADNNWPGIGRLSRRASYFSAAVATSAIIATAAMGGWLIPLVFGPAYAGTVAVLCVLLVGIYAEAIGGLSDEILKMTGRAWVVLTTLALSAGLLVLILIVDPGIGPVNAAWATVAAFAVQYVLQISWLGRYLQVHIWLAVPSARDRRHAKQ
ncbi:lipopolysaccharide biosynthesis protein [Microbacterium esteraromaticum]|uniref:lipopolysaccharide biosynthesis protein n=1 Tax=Microbacterium esteraromaticum TaxID=57043 RepID=UPI000B35C7A4|nr:hypothetical protein [Microbacterium esteraromaticum]